ncbi:MAG: hypothetical protein V4542_18420 [Pseudomonadota bacterium]
MKTEQQHSQSKAKKSTSGTSQVRMIDTNTGEMLDDGVTIHIPRKLRIKGFFMANQQGFEELAKSKLKGESFRVLLLMISRMDYENAISIRPTEIAEILKMHKQNVSRALKSLRTAGVFERESEHVVHLATEFGWKGKVQNLRKHNADAFKECGKRAEPTDADWKKMDAKIDALSKFSEVATNS